MWETAQINAPTRPILKHANRFRAEAIGVGVDRHGSVTDRRKRTRHLTGKSRMNVLLLNPRALYITARFAEACRRQSIDPTILLLPKPPSKRYLLSYVNDTFENLTEVPVAEDDVEAILPFLPPVDAVIPGGEFSVVFGERLAARLGVFHNPLDYITAYRNKYFMRGAFAEQGVDQPRILAKFDSMEEVERFDWSSVRFPTIVKPVDMTASMHVRLCDDARGAKQILQRIFKHTQSFSGLSFAAQGLLEEAVFGPEFSAECVIQNSRLIRLFSTTKFVSPYPACDEVGHLSGEPLSASISEQLIDTIERIVRAWALEAGIMHVEYKVCGNSVKVIEGACRIGGDMISELVELKYGVSLEECLLLLRSRRPVNSAFKNEVPDPDYYYGIKYLFDDDIGALMPTPDIEILRENWKEGVEYLKRIGSGFGVERRLGHQLVRGRSLAGLKTYLSRLEIANADARCA
jgi:hypothetical protein